MDDKKTAYNIQGSRVYGMGWSYNLTNQTDAVHLQNTLNNYETTINELKTQIRHETNYHEIQYQLNQLETTIHTLKNNINEIKELIK